MLMVSSDTVSNFCQITCLRACGCGTCRDSVCWLSWNRRLLCAALSGIHADLDWLSAPETPKFICGRQLAVCLWMYQLKVWIQFHHSSCFNINFKQAFTLLLKQHLQFCVLLVNLPAINIFFLLVNYMVNWYLYVLWIAEAPAALIAKAKVPFAVALWCPGVPISPQRNESVCFLVRLHQSQNPEDKRSWFSFSYFYLSCLMRQIFHLYHHMEFWMNIGW